MKDTKYYLCKNTIFFSPTLKKSGIPLKTGKENIIIFQTGPLLLSL